MATRALTQDDFTRVVASNHIVLVDFWADWCGWCKRFAPVYEASSTTHPEIVHATVDGEAEPGLVAAANITGYPTIVAFREGLLVYSQTGYLPSGEFEDVVQQVLWMDMNEFRRQHAQSDKGSVESQGAVASAHRAGPAPGPARYGWPGLFVR